MSVADVQQRIALIQATVGTYASPAASQVTKGGFADQLSRVMQAQKAMSSYDETSGSGDVGSDAVDLASEFMGTPYVWGGESPESGFDCSGLVQYVYGKLGVSLPRVSADQAKAGQPVAVADLQKGDLVFFGSPVDHVGIYAGGGKMVVAPKTGDVVKVQDINFDRVVAARRVAPSVAVGGSLALDALPPAGRPYAAAITAAAKKAGIDPKLLAALAWSESGFRADAKSSAGAIGLTQLMPATAAGMGVDPYNPTENLEGGARYLAVQLRRFGRADLALAAYNAGPTAVSRAGGIPPYAETQGFVNKVMERVRVLS